MVKRLIQFAGLVLGIFLGWRLGIFFLEQTAPRRLSPPLPTTPLTGSGSSRPPAPARPATSLAESTSAGSSAVAALPPSAQRDTGVAPVSDEAPQAAEAPEASRVGEEDVALEASQEAAPDAPPEAEAPETGAEEAEEPIDPSMAIAHCLSCNEQRQMVNPHRETTANGRAGLKGECEVCGRTLFRFVKEGDSS